MSSVTLAPLFVVYMYIRCPWARTWLISLSLEIEPSPLPAPATSYLIRQLTEYYPTSDLAVKKPRQDKGKNSLEFGVSFSSERKEGGGSKGREGKQFVPFVAFHLNSVYCGVRLAPLLLSLFSLCSAPNP
jgi:hypothetical protein